MIHFGTTVGCIFWLLRQSLLIHGGGGGVGGSGGTGYPQNKFLINTQILSNVFLA